MSDYVLRTRSISKKYGDAFAIENVSVDITQGQIYGLIGLNGAGKTTFMRSVTGLISLSSGEVELFGQTGERALQRARRRIGQSIETPAIYPDMTAEQNLEIQRIIGGVSEKGVVKHTLDVVGLAGTGTKQAKHFSLGMKQRLALAIALITDPQFLILDEPANGLDPEGIIEIRELMRRLVQERGLTLLVSSHLLDELARVATQYGIIHRGRLVKQLSAEQLALESRQCIRIITKEPARARALLQEHFAITDCQPVSATDLRVYEQTDRTGEMNTLLVHHGIVVEGIGVVEQQLEEYFLSLTGGKTA